MVNNRPLFRRSNRLGVSYAVILSGVFAAKASAQDDIADDIAMDYSKTKTLHV
jgi:hypothetical protein